MAEENPTDELGGVSNLVVDNSPTTNSKTAAELPKVAPFTTDESQSLSEHFKEEVKPHPNQLSEEMATGKAIEGMISARIEPQMKPVPVEVGILGNPLDLETPPSSKLIKESEEKAPNSEPTQGKVLLEHTEKSKQRLTQIQKLDRKAYHFAHGTFSGWVPK